MPSPTEIYAQHYNESHGAAVQAVFEAGRVQGLSEALADAPAIPVADVVVEQAGSTAEVPPLGTPEVQGDQSAADDNSDTVL